MTDFKLPTLDSDKPMANSPFFKHLLSLDSLPNYFYDAFDSWAATYGFIIGEHTVSEDVIDTARIVYGFAFSHWNYHKNTINLNDWFIPCHGADHEAFWVRGCDSMQHAQLTSDVIKWLNDNDMGLIYVLSPDNYYFQIIRDCLYIKYQSIIGGRVIAKIV